MNIRKTDVVLEIGSGNNPNPRSDILCDRFITRDHERAGEFPVVIDRPMIVADGYDLPFPDRSFDYIICSHVLEHMDDPKKFLKEVMRVAGRGYIEVPSAVSERIFGWDFHHWYCTSEGGELKLHRKTSGEQFGGFFHRLIARTIWFRRFFEENEHEMYVKIEWDKKVNINVSTKEPEKFQLTDLDTRAWELLRHACPDYSADILFYLKWIRRRAIRKCSKVIRLVIWRCKCLFMPETLLRRLAKYLLCPSCRYTAWSIEPNKLRCTHCRVSYRIVGNTIPVMLSESELSKGY